MAKHPKCELGTHFACNGIGVRMLTGVKKGDPKFRCCMGCEAYLKRMGIKTKEVVKKEKRT